MKKRLLFIVFIFISFFSYSQVDVQVHPNGKKYVPVLLNGSVSVKYDIVFIGDGFTQNEQVLFNSKVDEAILALRNLEPYKSYLSSFNIYRINVLSKESGVDRPSEGILRDTELDCKYGNRLQGEAERCITSSSPSKCYYAAGLAPAYDAVFVLVNDNTWGGCDNGIVFSSISSGFTSIVTHELGHKIADLADEYECYRCDGTDDLVYTGFEPKAINITTQLDHSFIKWNSLITQQTPIPTYEDSPAGVIGLFEGGGYYSRGIYRSQYNCQMRTPDATFCEVCKRELARVLSLHY